MHELFLWLSALLVTCTYPTPYVNIGMQTMHRSLVRSRSCVKNVVIRLTNPFHQNPKWIRASTQWNNCQSNPSPAKIDQVKIVPSNRPEMDEVISYSRLQDFDWSMRLVLTSDQITSLRKPILLVSFTTKESDGTKNEHIVEMSVDEANVFVEKLKQCQAAMKQIS